MPDSSQQCPSHQKIAEVMLRTKAEDKLEGAQLETLYAAYITENIHGIHMREKI